MDHRVRNGHVQIVYDAMFDLIADEATDGECITPLGSFRTVRRRTGPVDTSQVMSVPEPAVTLPVYDYLYFTPGPRVQLALNPQWAHANIEPIDSFIGPVAERSVGLLDATVTTVVQCIIDCAINAMVNGSCSTPIGTFKMTHKGDITQQIGYKQNKRVRNLLAEKFKEDTDG